MLPIVIIVELESCCTFVAHYGNTQLNLKCSQG